MISVLTVDGIEEELSILHADLKNIAAKETEDYWNYFCFSNISDMEKFLENQPLIDMACIDITLDGALERLAEYRSKYMDNGLLLITDTSMSPLLYLKPGIKADSLLMRPLEESVVNSTLKEFVRSFLETSSQNNQNRRYVIECQEGKIQVPYKDIYYFEAREKKVFLRTLKEEFGFYTTIEELTTSLPDEFLRCHRSYIVNSEKIVRIMISQNVIQLHHEMEVPLSRSYKPEFKKFGR